MKSYIEGITKLCVCVCMCVHVCVHALYMRACAPVHVLVRSWCKAFEIDQCQLITVITSKLWCHIKLLTWFYEFNDTVLVS